MLTPIVTIDPACSEQAFSRCRDVIRAGGVIAYPTDTFYGIGADPGNPGAVRRIFEIKGRRDDQPVLLLIPDAVAVETWAAEVTACAGDLMRNFWPGPLTLVFKAQPTVMPELLGGTGNIGLRVPGAVLTRELLRFLGSAITGTSANITGGPSPRTAAEAAASIGSMVDLILDGGATAGGKPSTVVDVRTAKPVIIREGAIPSHAILDREYKNQK
jgi:L-threonylcarbamoyladenylate synthase